MITLTAIGIITGSAAVCIAMRLPAILSGIAARIVFSFIMYHCCRYKRASIIRSALVACQTLAHIGVHHDSAADSADKTTSH